MIQAATMRFLSLFVGIIISNAPLSAQISPKMNELIKRVSDRSSTLSAEDRAQFIELIRPAVGLKETLADDALIGVGQSKIGGRPDLPALFEWPAYMNEPLTFCVQYNLAEAVPFDLEGTLPKQGLLSVFLYIDKGCPCFSDKPGSFKVIYSEDMSSLKRTDFPPDYFQGGIFRSAQLSFFQYFTVPAIESYKLKNLDKNRLVAFRTFGQAVEEIADSLSGLRGPDLPHFPTHNMHQLMGEDRPIQASAMLYFAWDLLGFNPVTKQLIAENEEKIDAIQRQYIILLQLDTVSSKFNNLDKYGGTGVFYFGIKPDDLKNKRFDRVVMTFQDT